jgi:hypothetical protein
MIEEQKKKKVNRGIVHVVAHSYQGVYYINPTGNLSVNIQQIDIWKGEKGLKKLVREVSLSEDIEQMLFNDYKNGQGLPGNICIIEQLQPVIKDSPEEHLYWNEEKTMVHRDNAGNAIYRYQTYCPNEPYQLTKEIDTLIL